MFYISEKDNKIYNNEELISEKLISIDITDESLPQLLFIDRLIDSVFICTRTYKSKRILEQIDLNYIEINWTTKFYPHISYKEEDEVDNFPLGYFYFPEFWENENKQLILILYYMH